MKLIPLTQGYTATVDDEDFDLVNQYKWRIRKDGFNIYAHTQIKKENGKRTTIHMHRLVMNASNSQLIDHRNHNGLDNQKANLRLCTRSQNSANYHRCSDKKSSQYKGVYKQNYSKRKSPNIGSWKQWIALIRVNNKLHSLGVYHAEDEAARAYDKAARQYFGEFASLNFPLSHEASALRTPQQST